MKPGGKGLDLSRVGRVSGSRRLYRESPCRGAPITTTLSIFKFDWPHAMGAEAKSHHDHALEFSPGTWEGPPNSFFYT